MMDIYSKGQYPSNSLSNFAAHAFVLDEVDCASMEGFLQSLKFSRQSKQVQVCKLAGKEAKMAPGKLRNLHWRVTQTVYWNGRKHKRCSEGYQRLISRAYDALFENADFRAALQATRGEKLCHSIGG